MDEDGCDPSRMRFFCYVTKINLSCNAVQSWIVDIFELYGLYYNQEYSYEGARTQLDSSSTCTDGVCRSIYFIGSR